MPEIGMREPGSHQRPGLNKNVSPGQSKIGQKVDTKKDGTYIDSQENQKIEYYQYNDRDQFAFICPVSHIWKSTSKRKQNSPVMIA
jgi:hypothetical protein